MIKKLLCKVFGHKPRDIPSSLTSIFQCARCLRIYDEDSGVEMMAVGEPHWPNVKCGCCTPKDVKDRDAKESRERLFGELDRAQARLMESYLKFIEDKNHDPKTIRED